MSGREQQSYSCIDYLQHVRERLRLAARGTNSFGALVSCKNTFLLR